MQKEQNNFKSWINHEDVILILNFSDSDDTFLSKKLAASIANKFISKMTGSKLRRFEDENN